MWRPTEEEALNNIMREEYLREKYNSKFDLLPIEEEILRMDRETMRMTKHGSNRLLVSRASGLPEELVSRILDTTAEKMEVFLILDKPFNDLLRE